MTDVDAILARAAAQNSTIRVQLGKRQFTGKLAGLGGEHPCILVVLPVSKSGACIEVCQSFTRRTLATLLKQGFVQWPTTSRSRMLSTSPRAKSKPTKR